MRLSPEVRLPPNPDSPYAIALNRSLVEVFRPIVQKLNAMCEGQLAAVDNAATAAPTTGTWRQGDFVRNSAPVEAGSASSKYIVIGWLCSVSGTPGTWLACRCLTGN